MRALAFVFASLLACSSVPAPVPSGDGAGGAAPTGPGADILADHLRASLPEGAIVAPRRASIMAAPSAATDETRVMLEPQAGETAKYVMLVSELFLLGTGNVVADADRLAAKGERAEALAGARLPIAILRPDPAQPPTDGPLFVLAAIVQHPDGTLQQAEFFILPEMRAELSAYAERSLAIARTLTAGARRIEAKGGTERLSGGLVLDVAAGYLMTTQQGPDFEVHRIRKLTQVGSAPGTLGIYLGGHPSLQHAQIAREGGEPPPAATEKGTLAGKEVSWIQWSTPSGTKVREAIGALGEGRSVHAFALSPDDATLADLMRIVATLRGE
jgi:hypothetical protein